MNRLEQKATRWYKFCLQEKERQRQRQGQIVQTGWEFFELCLAGALAWPLSLGHPASLQVRGRTDPDRVARLRSTTPPSAHTKQQSKRRMTPKMTGKYAHCNLLNISKWLLLFQWSQFLLFKLPWKGCLCCVAASLICLTLYIPQ